jgi:hypothetical protein
MSESNLESALARAAEDLSSAAEAIREAVVHYGDPLVPDSCSPDATSSHTERS